MELECSQAFIPSVAVGSKHDRVQQQRLYSISQKGNTKQGKLFTDRLVSACAVAMLKIHLKIKLILCGGKTTQGQERLVNMLSDLFLIITSVDA
jgi:hypothetical protein